MKTNILQDIRKGCHDNYNRDQDFPGCPEIFPVNFSVLPIRPYQGNGESGNKNKCEGNLSVRKWHKQK